MTETTTKDPRVLCKKPCMGLTGIELMCLLDEGHEGDCKAVACEQHPNPDKGQDDE